MYPSVVPLEPSMPLRSFADPMRADLVHDDGGDPIADAIRQADIDVEAGRPRILRTDSRYIGRQPVDPVSALRHAFVNDDGSRYAERFLDRYNQHVREAVESGKVSPPLRPIDRAELLRIGAAASRAFGPGTPPLSCPDGKTVWEAVARALPNQTYDLHVRHEDSGRAVVYPYFRALTYPTRVALPVEPAGVVLVDRYEVALYLYSGEDVQYEAIVYP